MKMSIGCTCTVYVFAATKTGTSNVVPLIFKLRNTNQTSTSSPNRKQTTSIGRSVFSGAEPTTTLLVDQRRELWLLSIFHRAFFSADLENRHNTHINFVFFLFLVARVLFRPETFSCSLIISTMRRPADQAKLLFLALLRSSAALATRQEGATATKLAAVAASATRTAGVSQPPSSAAADRLPSTLLDGHIALRVARRSDVPHIQQCNLATLPENYSATFYHNHMRQWPDLALVAEHVPAGCLPSRPTPSDVSMGSGSPTAFGGVRGSVRGRYNPQERIDGGDHNNEHLSTAEDDGRRIVGYVLGKVEQNVYTSSRDRVNNSNARPRNGILRTLPPSTVLDEDDERGLFEAMSNSLRRETENLGHVTSLAILQDYRRLGLAGELMEQLHHHMRHGYQADSVGLHVRVSNRAATRLYGDSMGYDVHDVIQHYYQDGEDAYFMRKDLNKEDSRERISAGYPSRVRRGIGSFAFRSRNNRPLWEVGPEEFRLPRLVADLEGKIVDAPSVTSTIATEEDDLDLSDIEEEQQVMSGAV